MIENMYSEFDPDITITAANRKSFHERELDWKKLAEIKEIQSFAKAVEEIVVLRHEKKWVNATLIGVEPVFLKNIQIDKHLLAGEPAFQTPEASYGIIGIELLQKLDATIQSLDEPENVVIYAPKKNIRIRLGKSPFYAEHVFLSATMNYNREVNEDKFLWPLDATRNLLQEPDLLTHVYVNVAQGISNQQAKEKIQQTLGNNFAVKTNYEKNELIFQTSKSERMVVVVIMIFIFILASFNLVASLTMLYIEKKDNINTLRSMGLSEKGIFRIFFFEGLLISGIGIVAGLALGYLICGLQLLFGWVVIPGPNIPFPMKIAFSDFLLVVCSVSALSVLFSWFPTKILLTQQRGKE